MYSIEQIKRNKQLFVLLCILVIGIFLRCYNFSDWLHYEIDQSYDTLLVSPAVEDGIDNLPLLGPTAGGGRALRLGPAFYYLEYISAKVFGNTPVGYAMLILIFSILSLPLFYLFCRIYFSRIVSAGLLAIYATSLYMVMYGRFSWSPNVLPLLILLCFYALLRSLSRKEKHSDLWFIISAATLFITTQIHFNAFFIIPAVFLIILTIKKPKFKWQTWIGVMLIFFIIYSPIIISDIETKGQNLHYFISKFSQSNKQNDTISEKIMQVVNYNSSEYFLIITGIDHVNEKRLTGYGFSSPAHRQWRIAAVAIQFLSLLVLIFNIYKEQDENKKIFLRLALAWFVISFAYFFLVKRDGLNIYPRFFLVVAPLAFIFFGFLMEKALQIKRFGMLLFILILALPIASNLRAINRYFVQLNDVDKKTISVETEDVFPNTARITLSQQKDIAEYIDSIYQDNHFPIFLDAKHEYEPVLWYQLEKKGIFYNSKMQNSGNIYQEANYFVVKFSLEQPKDYAQNFTIAEQKYFGALTVYRLLPKQESISNIRQSDSEKEIPIQKTQVGKIFTWNKLLYK